MESTRRCSVEGCDRKHDSHGLCGMHSMRHKRGRGVAQGRRARASYFRDQVNESPSGCWLWGGKVREDGYGQFSSDSLMAHRYAYELWVGPIPEGLQIDHLCMVKACVNPQHLEAVTAAENLRRRDVAYGMGSAVTSCPRGHAYDVINTYQSPSGRRNCRRCGRERMALRRKSKKEEL